ncbi:vWA domain-containing protein [Leptospira ilyithenensis]|nr:VWA domain-containing protein [Leptospira ilyithenensis]
MSFFSLHKKSKLTFLCLFYVLYISASPLAPISPNSKRYVFILDASGSMTEKLNGVTRMAIAKDQMIQFLSKLPRDNEVGLVAYGNRIAGCNSARLYHPIQRGGASAVINKLTGIIPAGSTPIAATIDLVGEFLLQTENETEIIFISDGIESCEGDPLHSLRILKDKGKKFNLQIIGIDLDKKAEDDLTRLALLGSGKYFSVKKREDIEDAFQSIFSPGAPHFPPKVAESETGPANIRIISILPYSSHSGLQTFILHYEYDGILPITDYMVHLNVFSKKEVHLTKELPPIREKRIADMGQTDVQFKEGRNGKGKLIFTVDPKSDWETSLELWAVDDIPKILAKSETKLLQRD